MNAFKQGFIKQAVANNVPQHIAETVFDEYEKIAALDHDMNTYRHRRQKLNQYLLTALGAGAGGLLGSGAGAGEGHQASNYNWGAGAA